MSITLLSGDARDVLPTLAANSVHCVVTSPPYYGLRSYLDAAHPDKHREIGSESTPDEYLTTMVAVMREVRRVLRPDGTVWCNIGDSYAGSPAGNFGTNRPEAGVFNNYRSNTALNTTKHAKPKDLLMMPARLALALQADGWWVRSAIVWSKPNPMPESVSDRPTSAYEMVYLLTKSARYFYDAEAVREDSEPSSLARAGIVRKASAKELAHVAEGHWNGAPGESGKEYGIGRNLRNVWTIATHAYPQAHFATYPPELAERCIRAGTSERGCCSACGAPWRRVVDKRFTTTRGQKDGGGNGLDATSRWAGWGNGVLDTTTTGWSASCACAAPTQPCTVLDPFAGAGTTLLVADRLQRNAIGVELNAAYTEMAMDRCRADAPLFADTPEPQPVPGFAQPDLFAEAAD